MANDNSEEPPRKTIFDEWVDPTPAYKVIGCLVLVGLAWGFIQQALILEIDGPLSASSFAWYLGQGSGFVFVISAVSSVIAGINFAIKRDGKRAKRWWAGSYILSGIALAYVYISAFS